MYVQGDLPLPGLNPLVLVELTLGIPLYHL